MYRFKISVTESAENCEIVITFFDEEKPLNDENCGNVGYLLKTEEMPPEIKDLHIRTLHNLAEIFEPLFSQACNEILRKERKFAQ